MNTDAEILDRFANDKFWGVRIEVVGHPNVSEAKLLERGVEFSEDGYPSIHRNKLKQIE